MSQVEVSGPAIGNIEAVLDALEAQGARGFDAPACDCVRALLTRAEELGGQVGAILVGRAQHHVEALRAEFQRERIRAKALLAHYVAERGSESDLEKKLGQGDFTQVVRSIRRFRSRPIRVQRGPRAVELVVTSDASRAAATATIRQNQALAYEDSVAEMVASLALARATDVVPQDAGPYNPLRIASSLLDRLRDVSPFYLTVQLNRLEELGSLLTLPELPEKEPEPLALPAKKKPAGRVKKS